MTSIVKLRQFPRVTDNDLGEITVTDPATGKELRGWSYASDAERRTKMLCAHEYVEGWHQGFGAALDRAEEIVKDMFEK